MAESRDDLRELMAMTMHQYLGDLAWEELHPSRQEAVKDVADAQLAALAESEVAITREQVTDEMADAGLTEGVTVFEARRVWRAMLAAGRIDR